MDTLPSSVNSSDQSALPAASASKTPSHGRIRMLKRRIPTGEVVETPMSDGAVVKMKLSRRPNLELKSFVGNHLAQMEDNPNFPDQQPPPALLQALFEAFSSDMAQVQAARTELEVALTACEASRTALVQGMQVRGAYVQAKSNGNTNLIVNSGLDVRSDPTPVGELPPPLHLTVTLNGITGMMKFSWSKVENARGYLLEYSPDVTPRRFVSLTNTTKTKFAILLPTGQTYVFRVAASGGSTGQSAFSAEVVRGAA